MKPKLKATHTKADLAGIHEAPEGMAYFAIGANCWGKSKSALQAMTNARRNGSRGLYVLHLVNEGAEVDCVDGTLYHNSATPGLNLNMAWVRL